MHRSSRGKLQTSIQQLLQSAKAKRIDYLDAELIIAHVLKKSREFVLARPEYKVSKFASQQVNKLIKKCAQGAPIAYLTGHKEFFGLDFMVNKHVLIPRPETEILVKAVLENLKSKTYKLKLILIDIGTGSGCIPIAIANQIRKSGLSVIRKFYATDISQSALAVARRNAKRHGVKIKFLHGNLLSPFFKTYNLKSITYNLTITANLPYLTQAQYQSSASIKSEPKQALIAGKDGLKYYKELLKQISQNLFLAPYSLFLEIDPSQSKPIKLLIKKHLPQAKIIIHKDLAGRDRVAEIC